MSVVHTRASLALVALVSLAGCASGARRETSIIPRARSRGVGDLQRCAAASLYECLAMADPAFVRSLGADVTVFVNGVPVGAASTLHSIRMMDVRQIRLLTRAELGVRPGAVATGTALAVTVRP